MLLSIFILIFGAMLLLFGYTMRKSHRKLQRVGVITQATVVDYKTRGDNDAKDASFYLMLEFKTHGGKVITVRAKASKSEKEAQRMKQEKAQVEIIYDPAQPTKYNVNAGFYEYFPLILLALGLIGIVTGIFGALGIIPMPEGESSLGV